MWNIALDETLEKLPVAKLEQEVAELLEPMSSLLPEKRVRDVLRQMVRCILATETPVITAMSRSVPIGSGLLGSCQAGVSFFGRQAVHRWWRRMFHHL